MEQGVVEHLHVEFYLSYLFMCNFLLHPVPFCITERRGWPLPNPMKNPEHPQTRL